MFETGKTAQVMKEIERNLQANEKGKARDPKPSGERQLTLN